MISVRKINIYTILFMVLTSSILGAQEKTILADLEKRLSDAIAKNDSAAVQRVLEEEVIYSEGVSPVLYTINLKNFSKTKHSFLYDALNNLKESLKEVGVKLDSKKPGKKFSISEIKRPLVQLSIGISKLIDDSNDLKKIKKLNSAWRIVLTIYLKTIDDRIPTDVASTNLIKELATQLEG